MDRFHESLILKRKAGHIPVIPDIKLRSPKVGDLFAGRDPLEAAKLMESLGAPALSVVTEEQNFGGSLQLLEDVVKAVSIPVLRKDFITAEDGLRRTRDAGAAAVLLICSKLPEERLKMLYEMALHLALEPLVEAHTPSELALAGSLGAKLVGINNRDIGALEKDDGGVSRTIELMAYAPEGAVLISESGVSAPSEAAAALRAGAGAVLVGTALWKAGDTARFYRAMCLGKDEDEQG